MIDVKEFDVEECDTLATTLATSAATIFQETTVANAKTLTNGINLSTNNTDSIILPFLGYGTYKLGKEIARSKTLEALRQGYRCIDTVRITVARKTLP